MDFFVKIGRTPCEFLMNIGFGGIKTLSFGSSCDVFHSIPLDYGKVAAMNTHGRKSIFANAGHAAAASGTYYFYFYL